ncbi:MAG TPA: hypothetical protein QGH10_19180 [Armatimonadota bacterium]|nr:hypothetical protein [Armatimonadota bacterium]
MVIDYVDVSSGVYQVLHHVEVATKSSEAQRSAAVVIGQVHVSSGFHQGLDFSDMPRPNGRT